MCEYLWVLLPAFLLATLLIRLSLHRVQEQAQDAHIAAVCVSKHMDTLVNVVLNSGDQHLQSLRVLQGQLAKIKTVFV